MLLSVNPLVYYEDNFLSDEECATIIENARDNLQSATVCNDEGTSSDDSRRTGGTCFLPQETNEAIMKLCIRIADKINTHPIYAEHLQVINYGAGEEYQPHYDSWQPHEYQYTVYAGNRTMTALAYLNDVEEGGATVFPMLGVTIPPKKGRIVFFTNTHLGSNVRHELSLHGSEPVTKGEKWACNLWFREKHFQLPHIYNNDDRLKIPQV